ncbi:MAG: 50S ribosomal protein L29 [Flavobacteriales bacterium]|jgi:large subunit ribosomal protein L29|nr:50S ribosomal protein L29 [Taibaiella sp.]OJV56283.1 MAG: 50S ribosomal protein L29 [Bacteroidetes bacterium 43-16]RYF23625.1 MAG: 50S ribosomal protein L29 [Flavobacteriales bacterium]
MAKAKNTEDYRSLSDEALVDRINAEVDRLNKMKFSHAVNPIENPMAIRGVRREISQLKTEQRKRQLGN